MKEPDGSTGRPGAASRADMMAELAALRQQVAGLEAKYNQVKADSVRQAEALASRQQDDFWHQVVERAGEGIVVSDGDAFLVYNRRMQEISGYTLQDTASPHFLDMLFPDPAARDSAEAFVEALLQGRRVDHSEWEITRKDGERRNVLTSASDFVHGGQRLFLIVVRDVTTQTAAAVHNAHLYQVERKRATQLAVVNRVARKAASALVSDQLLQEIVDAIQAGFGYYSVILMPLDPATNQLRNQVVAGGFKEIASLDYCQKVGDGLIGRVAKTGQPLLVNDITCDSRYIVGFGQQVPTRAEMCVPLKLDDQVIGVLDVQEVHRDAFDDTDLVAVETLADQIAIAIRNAHLFQSQQEQRALSEALANAAAVVNSTLNLDQVLDHILEQVERVVAGDAFSIMLVENEVAHMERWRGYESLGADAQPVGYVMPIADYPNFSKMSRTGKSVVVPDTSIDSDWVPGRPAIAPNVAAQLNVVPADDRKWRKAYVGAPIQIQGKTAGFLNVVGLHTGQFGPQDGQRLETFASHAATAIENAQLYEQARQDAEMRAVLLDEVNHRVKNNLTAIMGLLHVEQRYLEGEARSACRPMVDGLINRIQGLATVHSMLSASEWSSLRLSQLADQVIRASLQVLLRDKRVAVEVSPSGVEVTPEQAHSLALVINELVANTVKHALLDRNTAHIKVGIAQDPAAEHSVRFEFRDDGPGYPEGVLKGVQGNVGFDLIPNIVRRNLQGELSISNDRGAVTVIQFKLER
ncbi:MAG: GAF domain-containing protein [Anaerolineae bacterium]|nr:GAF domain-containing protein [Anaerolineae bacterium]